MPSDKGSWRPTPAPKPKLMTNTDVGRVGSNPGRVGRSSASNEASQMLEAALQQMDGIIAGKRI